MTKAKKRNRSGLDVVRTLRTPANFEAEAFQYFQQGERQFNNKQFKAALPPLRKALKIYQEIHHRENQTAVLDLLARAYFSLKEYRSAIKEIECALAVLEVIGYGQEKSPFLKNLAIAYERRGLQQKEACSVSAAIQSWEKALSIYQDLHDWEGECKCINYLGSANQHWGKYCQAIELRNKALVIARKNGCDKLEAQFLHNLAHDYTKIGHYQQAIDYYQQALDIKRKLGMKVPEGWTLLNLGTVSYLFGDYEEAINRFKQSLKIAVAMIKQFANRSIEREDAQNLEGKSINSLGMVYRSQKKYKEAIEYYEEGLAIFKEIGNRFEQRETLVVLVIACIEKREYQKAIKYYQQWQNFTIVNDSPGVAASLFNLSVDIYFYNLVKDYSDLKKSQLIKSCEESLAISRKINDFHTTAKLLICLGAALLEFGNLEEAESKLREAVEVWENLRIGLRNDADKVSFFDTQADAYSLLQETLVNQNKTNSALEIAERGRGRALIDFLAIRLSVQNLDETQNARLLEATNPPTIDIIKEIAKERNSTLILYSIIYSYDLYIWVITPTGDINFFPVDIQLLVEEYNSIEELTKDTLEQIQSGSFYQYKHLLQVLYKYLIEPIAASLPTDPNAPIIFIPQRDLSLVPFPALHDAITDKFLIEQHTVLIAPSIMALKLTRQKKERIRNMDWNLEQNQINALIVGNPTMPSENLQLLPYAEEEAKEIASLLNTKAIIGDNATKLYIVEQMPKARLIHLATHGLSEIHKSGIPGAIALAQSGKDNGYLTSSDILDLELNAELVVLSACNIGKGRITEDGVIGLSRCLLLAGVPSVIVSLWEVDDSSTKLLMTQFYRNLQNGLNKAQALREAMLATMQANPNCPKAWAAFTLIGEAD
jgi:CHAT domain-containing protein/Tfp pilus assembly protein PilF